MIKNKPLKHMKIKEKCTVCTERKDILSINLCNCTRLCRYYKYPTRRFFTNDTLAPKGMCIDLFHSAYPTCLSLLYGGKYNGKVIVFCPNPDANFSVEITKKSTKTKIFRRFVAWLLSKFYERIVQIPDTEIIMTIRNNTNSNCIYSYKKGQKFKFNIWFGREVCPGLFDVLYPSIHNLIRNGNIPWGVINKKNVIICPDPKRNITMSISKK